MNFNLTTVVRHENTTNQHSNEYKIVISSSRSVTEGAYEKIYSCSARKMEQIKSILEEEREPSRACRGGEEYIHRVNRLVPAVPGGKRLLKRKLVDQQPGVVAGPKLVRPIDQLHARYIGSQVVEDDKTVIVSVWYNGMYREHSVDSRNRLAAVAAMLYKETNQVWVVTPGEEVGRSVDFVATMLLRGGARNNTGRNGGSSCAGQPAKSAKGGKGKGKGKGHSGKKKPSFTGPGLKKPEGVESSAIKSNGYDPDVVNRSKLEMEIQKNLLNIQENNKALETFTKGAADLDPSGQIVQGLMANSRAFDELRKKLNQGKVKIDDKKDKLSRSKKGNRVEDKVAQAKLDDANKQAGEKDGIEEHKEYVVEMEQPEPTDPSDDVPKVETPGALGPVMASPDCEPLHIVDYIRNDQLFYIRTDQIVYGADGKPEVAKFGKLSLPRLPSSLLDSLHEYWEERGVEIARRPWLTKDFKVGVGKPKTNLPRSGLYWKTRDMRVKDCGGLINCGMVAIDIAADNHVSAKRYLEYRQDAGLTVQECGHVVNLGFYAGTLGYNTLFYDSEGCLLYECVTDPTWKTIALQNNGNDHWLLLLSYKPHDLVREGTKQQLSRACTKADVMEFLKYGVFDYHTDTGPLSIDLYLDSSWFLRKMSEIGCSLVEDRMVVHSKLLNKSTHATNDRELRDHRKARDKKEVNDMIDRVEVTVMYTIFCDVHTLKVCIPVSRVASRFAHKTLLMHHVGKLPLTSCLSEVEVQMNSVNASSDLTHLITNAYHHQLLFIGAKVRPEDHEFHEGVYSAVGSQSTIPNMSKVVVNQLTGARTELAKKGETSVGANYVVRAKTKLKFAKSTRKNAAAGLVFVDSEGPISNGQYPGSGTADTVVAFGTRAQNQKETATKAISDEMIDWGKEFYKPFIDSTDVGNIKVEEPAVVFRRVYSGSKSQKWIDKCLEDHRKYLGGLMNRTQRKRHLRHSCFIKWEHSVKNGLCRPRMIMTMSSWMTIEGCQLLDVLHAWNAGKMRHYQIKSMGQEEQINLILSLCDREHIVTDFSAFESSIMGAVREVEAYILNTLLEKAGLHQVKQALRDMLGPTRDLHTNGAVFHIESRCSGDFITSVGNGIVNLLLQMFCAHKKGMDVEQIRMVVEGDDGLMESGVSDKKLLNSLGFSFSTEMKGTEPGDCDFLSVLWTSGGIMMNVPKAIINLLFIKDGEKLKISKRRYLLRVKAYSLYLRSPKHPIILALIIRIGRLTQGAQPFKNWKAYVDHWRGDDKIQIGNFPTWDGEAELDVDSTLRATLARGSSEFPPISVFQQKVLEREILSGAHKMFIGTVFQDYPIYQAFKQEDMFKEPLVKVSDDVDKLLTLLSHACPGWKGVDVATITER